MKTVFISRNEVDLCLIPSFCRENNIRLIAQSFIDFKELPFQLAHPYDVLFVNSIRAFEYFTKSVPISETCQIACLGETTAKKVMQLGFSSDFVGSRAGNPGFIAKNFKKWVGDRRVLIPCSSRSARSIAKELDPAQAMEIIVYETVLTPHPLEHADVYIFTSPSNVDSFFSVNNTGDALVMAWGKTTQQALSSLGVKNLVTLEEATEEEAVAILNKER